MSHTAEISDIPQGPEGHDVRDELMMDAIDAASDQDQRTWVTSHGKRVAMVCTVEDGERLELGGLT